MGVFIVCTEGAGGGAKCAHKAARSARHEGLPNGRIVSMCNH